MRKITPALLISLGIFRAKLQQDVVYKNSRYPGVIATSAKYSGESEHAEFSAVSTLIFPAGYRSPLLSLRGPACGGLLEDYHK